MGWSGDLIAMAMVGLLGSAAWADMATRTIPDRISIGLVCLGIANRLLVGLSGLAISVAVALVLFSLLVVAHGRGLLGGGDVKLAAATALGLPPEAIYRFIVATSMAGGVLALIHLALRFALRGFSTARPPPRGAWLPRRIFAAERWRIAQHGTLPYGIAIACGGIFAVLAGRGG
jgi:prepilin peptidase CpaA